MTLSLNRDWDYFASMAQTLRSYLFEHHTVPQWNFMLCGKPELANPQSWAFTWPSLIVYALPPQAALIFLWSLCTAIGWLSVRRLFRDWGADAGGAAVGATIYAFSGFFAAHLGQGHATFAFFHLVPLLILLNSRLAAAAVGRAGLGPFLLATAAAFLFFSAALPHALYYFYPLVPFAALIDAWRHRRVKGLGQVLMAQIAGILLSAYKLWPVIAWQLSSPRNGSIEEHLTPLDVVLDLFRFAKNYDRMGAMDFENQAWFPWEYNAFIGWTLPLVLAFWAWDRVRRHGPTFAWSALAPAPTAVFAGVAVLLGLDLALGNASPLSLARFFQDLPLVNGIRGFGRYQILIVFGLAVFAAMAVTGLRRAFAAGPWATAALTLGVSLPVVVQFVTLVGAIKGTTDQELAALYGPPRLGPVPVLAKQLDGLRDHTSDHAYLLDSGYWVANCYEPLRVLRSRFAGATAPLTDPPPTALVTLGSDHMTLAYAAASAGPVRVNLGDAEHLSFDAPARQDADGAVYVDLTGRGAAPQLTITRRLDAPRQGLVVSGLAAAALLAAAAVRLASRRRQLRGGD